MSLTQISCEALNEEASKLICEAVQLFHVSGSSEDARSCQNLSMRCNRGERDVEREGGVCIH